MKDAYSFDLDEAGARNSYYTQLLAYLRTFQRLGIRAVPMKAASGPIGGDLSHEFIVLAPTGESEVFYDAAFEEFDWAPAISTITTKPGSTACSSRSAAPMPRPTRPTTRRAGPTSPRTAAAPGAGSRSGISSRSATNIRQRWGSRSPGQDGNFVTPQMGSYGIGVSRLVGAIIEASHDDNGIIWPDAVAPWQVGLVTMRGDDAASIAAADDIYARLTAAGVETLYDDRDERGGVKLGSMDLIGLPWQLILGPRGLAAGTVELKNRRTGEKLELTIDEALARLTA